MDLSHRADLDQRLFGAQGLASILHGLRPDALVCFSCHGPERYTAAKERASSFLASAVATASGVEDLTIAQAAERRPDTLPAGYPRMGRSQVKNIAGLKQAVARWNDYFNPKLTENELDDLVAYLNAAYYKF